MQISRRSLLAMASVVATSSVNRVLAQSGATALPYSDPKITDDWILQWMSSPQAATLTLHLGRFADAMYFLREPIGWKPNPGQELHKAVSVPVGFVTDFASIPRVFWMVLPKDGVYTYPAIIHDYLYWEQSVSRDEADLILRYSMEDFKVNSAALNTIFAGVRAGGASAWASNTALKAAGERRFLRIYPTDPTITWETYRKQPNVFR